MTTSLILAATLLAPIASTQTQSLPSAQRIGAITPEQAEILSHMSILYLDDGLGGTVKTIRLTGANWQIVDGSGATDGAPTGLGNLIVGYNELRGMGDDRTGSHNMIGGKEHNYTRFGGLVVGKENEILGDWSSVSAGGRNTASATFSSVSGGYNNIANANYSAVSGGYRNIASGLASSISGGGVNSATTIYASISGGLENTASGGGASVSGGSSNVASAYFSSVSGGQRNTASEYYSSVSGGYQNVASGFRSSVSGGTARSAVGPTNWSAGSLTEAN